MVMKFTETQRKKLLTNLKNYRSTYLSKKNWELDESATRIMINYFLTQVLGFTELEEIKTEYAIRGMYADYVIQSNRKKHFIVEVKSIALNLSEKHIRQALGYGANEGIDWILLTNGKQFQLYRIIFGKPVKYSLLFDFDLSDLKEMRKSVDFFVHITKKFVEKGELEKFWNRCQALEAKKLIKILCSDEVIRLFRRVLRKETKFTFSNQELLDSVQKIVIK